MKLKYWGAEYEKGLTLTADLFDREGASIATGLAMTETVLGSSAIYKTDDILKTVSISPGVYVVRIINSTGEFIGHDELIFNGVREITLLEIRFMSDQELRQLRDALGIDGDKMVARDGQLQKKSESPYNEYIDTKKINKIIE